MRAAAVSAPHHERRIPAARCAEEMTVFNRESCKACGACILACPFVEVPRKDAKAEIASLIQGRGSKAILRSCAGCTYCDVICPTDSNPSHLREERRIEKIRRSGVSCLSLISEEVPMNIMSLGLEFEREKKLERLELYSRSAPGKEVFYLGCSLSYIYTDLADMKLLNELPVIGGMKFCCGGLVRSQFGEEEAIIRGRRLLRDLKELGVESMVTFCPECDRMIGDCYPRLIPEFDIKSRNIVSYLLERHGRGDLAFPERIDRKVTFHDSCAWRKMEPEMHGNPRKLLDLMGAEVVEMKHNRRKSMCCGAPLAGRDPQLAARVAEKRVAEAKETGAEILVIGCTGCFALSEQATSQGLEIYHITELAQLAMGEEPAHRIQEIRSQLRQRIVKAITEERDALAKRYVIRSGEIILL